MNDDLLLTEERRLLVSYFDENVSRLSADKLEHFRHLLESLLGCYIFEQSRALVLLHEMPPGCEQVSLIAVNSDDDETTEMIDTLCVFRKLDFDPETTLN